MIICHTTALSGACCDAVATHRYTWPGQHEAAICDAHLPVLQAAAADLGVDLDVDPLTLADHANPVHPLTIKVPK